MLSTRPRCVALPANRPPRDYRGGRLITAFRGDEAGPDDNRTPEDWLASTTTLFGEDETGLTCDVEASGFLRDIVRADPHAYLGPEHTHAYGDDPLLLTKLLNPAQRLPVHVHPDRAFAGQHLGCTHGKSEAWVVLATASESASVWLGFRADVTGADLAGWVDTQDTARLLGALNELRVQPGDVVFVPAGTPHAIGPDVLVLELQEPTDFSIMLEYAPFGRSSHEAFLGLPPTTALAATGLTQLTGRALEKLRTRDPLAAGRHGLLPDQAAPFFRAERLNANGAPVTATHAFGVLVITDGTGELHEGDSAAPRPVRAGDVLLTPYAAGPVSLDGQLRAVHCLPPEPRSAP